MAERSYQSVLDRQTLSMGAIYILLFLHIIIYYYNNILYAMVYYLIRLELNEE